MAAPVRTILILGGTREASGLAAHLAARKEWRVVTSLAGRTTNPSAVSGEVRTGGFGGADGLAAYLTAEAVDCVVDATHPFATTISLNAEQACSKTDTRLVRFARPPWTPEAGDAWTMIDTLDEAAHALPSGARAFLALGSQHLAAFAGRTDCFFLVRMIDTPEKRLPLARYALEIALPSASPDAEKDLLMRRAISHIVCRNSGGTGAAAKLAAARNLGLPVVMVRRPPVAGPALETLDAALAAIG